MSSTATLRQTIAATRSRVRISESEARRTGAAFVGAAVIGIASKPDDRGEILMKKLEVFGLPGSVVLAILAKGGASFMSGDTADYMNGLGDAAAIIAISKFAQGQDVSGMDVAGARSRRRRGGGSRRDIERLESELSSRVDDIDRELAALDD